MKKIIKITLDLNYKSDREIYEYFCKFPKLVRAVKIREALIHYLRHHGEDRRLFDTILSERAGITKELSIEPPNQNLRKERVQNITQPEATTVSRLETDTRKEQPEDFINKNRDIENSIWKLIEKL